MKVNIKKLPKSEVELEIELDKNEFEHFYKKAILELGKDLELEGFRKGKAPENIIEKKLKKERILAKAREIAIKEKYKEAVLKNNIEPISRPEIKILKMSEESLIFRARTVVMPEVNLPDYRKIATKQRKNKVIVEESEIEESFEWLLKSRAKFSLKNNPAEPDDFVKIRYWSKEIPELNKPEGQIDNFILKKGGFIPGFEDNLIGMRANEEKKFSLTLPQNYKNKDLAGKKIDFRVKMESVQKVEIPKATDDFARSLGKFSSLKDLKKNIKEGITKEKEMAESWRLRSQIVKDISQETKIDIPEILIKKQQDFLVRDFRQRIEEGLKMPFKEYLEKIKKTEEEINNSFYEEAKKRTKEFLILEAVGKKEKIEVTDEEIKEEADKILKHYKDIRQAEKEFEVEKLREYVKEIIRNEKIFQMLEGLAEKT